MAKYTVELKDVVKSGTKIFDFDYTFFNSSQKEDFENKFIHHFYFKEIGFETVGRFQHYLQDKCNLVLPYYNMLLETAQLKYDLLNNYNLTETMTKTSSNKKNVDGSVNGNSVVDGNTSGTSNTNQSNTRESSVESQSSKDNTLNSTTNHTDSTDTTKNDKYKDTNIVDNLHTTVVDNKKVGSETPSGLLSMDNLEKNIYATDATLETNQNKQFEKKNEQLSKTNETSEKNSTTSTDDVSGSSRDTSNDSSNERGTESSNGSVTNVGNFGNTSSNTATSKQNEDEIGNENYTLERVGNIGVDKPSNMLTAHIDLQKTLTTIYMQFFDECEDLFMQIY